LRPVLSSTKIQLHCENSTKVTKIYNTQKAKKPVFSMLCGTLQNAKKRQNSNSDSEGRGFESRQPYHSKKACNFNGLRRWLQALFMLMYRAENGE